MQSIAPRFRVLRSGWLTREPAQPADSTAPADAVRGKGFRERRRNRHGRGLRGELMLPTLPGYRTRSDRFDDMVLDSAQRLHDIWGKAAGRCPVCRGRDPAGPGTAGCGPGPPRPWALYEPATADEGPVITLYRRVVEQACCQPRRTPGPGARRRGGTHRRDAGRARRKRWTRCTAAATNM